MPKLKKVSIEKSEYEQKRRDRERLLKIKDLHMQAKELHKKEGKILEQIKEV